MLLRTEQLMLLRTRADQQQDWARGQRTARPNYPEDSVREKLGGEEVEHLRHVGGSVIMCTLRLVGVFNRLKRESASAHGLSSRREFNRLMRESRSTAH